MNSVYLENVHFKLVILERLFFGDCSFVDCSLGNCSLDIFDTNSNS